MPKQNSSKHRYLELTIKINKFQSKKLIYTLAIGEMSNIRSSTNQRENSQKEKQPVDNSHLQIKTNNFKPRKENPDYKMKQLAGKKDDRILTTNNLTPTSITVRSNDK